MLKKILADQVDVEMTELSGDLVLLGGGRLLGPLSWSIRRTSRCASAAALSTSCVVFRPKSARPSGEVLAGHGARVGDLARPEGKYLPRMAVSAAARRTGIVARKIMNHVSVSIPTSSSRFMWRRPSDIVIRLHTSRLHAAIRTWISIVVLVRPRMNGIEHGPGRNHDSATIGPRAQSLSNFVDPRSEVRSRRHTSDRNPWRLRQSGVATTTSRRKVGRRWRIEPHSSIPVVAPKNNLVSDPASGGAGRRPVSKIGFKRTRSFSGEAPLQLCDFLTGTS